jgi:transcriptional regulator with PAS, ATPase and Fis domain
MTVTEWPINLDELINVFEKSLIEQALKHAGSNTEAAKILGITKRSIRYRIARLWRTV